MLSHDEVWFGIDLGATNGIIMAFSDPSDPSSLLKCVKFTLTQTDEKGRGSFNQDFNAMCRASWQLRRECEAKRIMGVGLAAAGKPNDARTELEDAGNLKHWVGAPFVSMLAQELECPVYMCNDAEAATLAEATHGLLRRRDFAGRDFICVTWGTGIGVGLGFAHDGDYTIRTTELGHTTVSESGLRCGCGLPDCWEAHCGGKSMAKYANQDPATFTAQQWKNVIPYMVRGVRNALLASRGRLVVFGGGIACKHTDLLLPIENGLKHAMLGAPPVLLSEFGDFAGAIGAMTYFARMAALTPVS